MTQFDFSPSWGPLALSAIRRLQADKEAGQPVRAPQADAYDDFDMPIDDTPFDLDAEPPETTPQGDASDTESIKEETSTPALDGPADSNMPVNFLGARDLALTLRLAATFGTLDRVANVTKPGALTVLRGCSLDETPDLTRILGRGFLPDGSIRLDKLGHRRSEQPALTILTLENDQKNAPLANLADALASSDQPVLLYMPVGTRLPEVVAANLPAPLKLAALDRHLTLVQLHLTYPGELDLAALWDALPDDASLAALPEITRMLALRAPTAMAAADRLVTAVAQPRRAAVPRLDQMTGDGEALQVARRLVADLNAWKSGAVAWSDLTRSMLLVGPPGTGKTFLAQAMGASADATFVSGSFAEWQAAGHLGHMLAAMRATFAKACENTPAILFIDEIDAAGSRLQSDQHNSNYQRNVINAFLQELDGVMHAQGVLVIGATNDVGALDPAILRPGRFDQQVSVPLPDAQTLHGILRTHLDLTDADLRDLARDGVGMSAADIDAAIRAAKSQARAQNRALSLDDLRRQITGDDPREAAQDWRVAVHECGHAIVYHALGLGTIARLLLRRDSGGETHIGARRALATLADIEDELAFQLAGRAAETLVLGEASGGAGGDTMSDLARATTRATWIETRYGLGHHELIWLDEPEHVSLRNPHVYGRVRTRLAKAQKRATTILETHRAVLDAMARDLLAQRELVGEELAKRLEGVCCQRTANDHAAPPKLGRDHADDLFRRGVTTQGSNSAAR